MSKGSRNDFILFAELGLSLLANQQLAISMVDKETVTKEKNTRQRKTEEEENMTQSQAVFQIQK